MSELKIAGECFLVYYNFVGGYVTNLEKMIKIFHLSPNCTITFKMDNSNVMHGKIYEKDGKEIDTPYSTWSVTKCIWNVNSDSESGIIKYNT